MRPDRLIACLALLSGCGDPVDEEPVPPAICRTPEAPPEKWFTEVTAEVGLAATTAFEPIATLVAAADLDGDGFADLVASNGDVARETDGGKRAHFVLMNRPAAGDSKRRVFVDATAESGLMATRDGVGGRGFSVVTLGDLDNDGDVDAVLCPGSTQADDPCAAFLNDGSARFTLAPMGELEGAGSMQSASAALVDLDRDGKLDFWPAAFGTVPYLFRGAGDGTFRDVAEAWGLPATNGRAAEHRSYRQTFGVAACDLDGDGDQDVLLADYGREHNQVWLNDGAGQLTEDGERLGLAADERKDFSDDLSYRCWCAQNAGKCPASVPEPGVQCSNPCNPTKERCWSPGVSDQDWRLGGNTFSFVCGDIDNDGDMDAMTAEIRHWDVGSASDPSELILNVSPPGGPLEPFVRPGNETNGLFREETGAWNEGDMTPVFADVDLDGRKDIYLASSDYPGDHGWLWRQTSDGQFEDLSTKSGAGQKQIHGVALVDIDNDGDLDLVAGTSTARGVAKTQALRVYRNDVGQASNWIQLRLVGLGEGKANRSAIGARVSVTAGGVTQVQEVPGGWGHTATLGGHVLTFGLGAACEVDRVEVRWPDAAQSKSLLKKLRANYRVEITQGKTTPHYVQ